MIGVKPQRKGKIGLGLRTEPLQRSEGQGRGEVGVETTVVMKVIVIDLADYTLEAIWASE